MSVYLGIDTSNYTTSAALYDSSTGRVVSKRQLLPVEKGAAGLRQADAVFAHVRQLPAVVSALFSDGHPNIRAVCASTVPRRAEGSYMPAFLVGEGAGKEIAASLGVPFYGCSHQEGHVLSALHSAGVMDWLHEEFYAFHVSGGTTECLLVRPDGTRFQIERLAGTLDLNAGQLIDRTGLMLGLAFPCGMELDKLSLQWEEPMKAKASLKGLDCCLSGGENQAAQQHRQGYPPAAVARFAIEFVRSAIGGMTERVMERYGKKPLLYAGGVMSNRLIRRDFETRYDGRFASPEFSSDNASGPAIFASIQDKESLS